ncbi:GNAT family N-acetyltransferase [Actinokineospora auranticolor]|uniref:N-acetylglutamate synthase-like GNAT family acetyltransferase n=1 Tax=Actinokineospora auranticolor TaxID=155976 RepID=A0A2S6GXD2_9PSEU|nr:GNAT family N-acetyltransferase [Actinokineospora auranticolor]PPK69858.1 N-acetylglutamate synthase-like GNAT family acetyltransferase [Actinokineospora auranticolor]
MPDPRVRRAEESDVDTIVQLVRDLAEYEQALHESRMTAEQLRQALFCPDPALFCHVAEVDGEVVGCALWFLNFSTWRGTHGIHLEDLYVRPDHRGSGLGRALLVTLARECADKGYQRLEWGVLDWNKPAIDFYDAMGAHQVGGWYMYRLADESLLKVAGT